MQAIQEIEDKDFRNWTLVELMVHLPDNLSEVLQSLEEIEDEYWRAQALESLVPKLPNNLLPQALQIAQKLESDGDRVELLGKLVSRLPQNLLSQSLQIIQWESPYSGEVLDKMIPRLPEELLPQALRIIQGLKNCEDRARTLETLAPKLSEELLPQALQIAREIEDSWVRDEALATLAFYLPDSLSLQALQILQEVNSSNSRAEVLIKLAPQLPKYLLPQALKIAYKIEDEYGRVNALGNLALHFPEVRPEVLEVVKKIKDKQNRAQNLRILAPLFPELWPEALQTARKIKNCENRACALGQLTSEFPERWPEAIQTARKIKNKRTRIDVLTDLAAKAPETFLAQALQVTQEILREYSPQEYQRARLLRKATEFYYESRWSVQNIKSSRLVLLHASALINLAAQLLILRPQVFQISQKIEWEFFHKVECLMGTLAAQISEDLLPKALKIAQGIEHDYYRTKVLYDLSRRFPKLLPEAFRAAQDIDGLDDLSMSLIRLVLNTISVLPLCLAQELLQEILFLYSRYSIVACPKGEYAIEPIIESELIQRYVDYEFLNLPVENVLQVSQWYQLEISIRETPNGIPTDENVRRSIREPRQQSPVTIWVTAESASNKFEISEPVQTLELPPKGDSIQNAVFRVRPIQKSVNAENLSKIRIRAYYKFNLLEVAIIQAEVVGQFDDPSHSRLGLENPITFKQERLEREYLDFDDIEPREMHVDIRKENDNFVFNFLFLNESSQRIEFTAPICIPALDLEDALLNVRKLWHDIAMSKTFTTQLEGDDDEFLENIQKLARAGRNLWLKLFKQKLDKAMFKVGQWLEDHPLKPGAIIQFSQAGNAADFVFPWALLYDQKLPRKAYEMPDLEGFWGLRYCIEQRLTTITDQAAQASEKLKLGFMLWEQFRNAAQQKSLMKHLVSESLGTLEVTIPPVSDVDDFFDLLDDDDCQILYFYTHGYTRHREADIGTGKNLDLFMSSFRSLPNKDPRFEELSRLYQNIREGKFEPDRSWIELSYGKLYLDQLYDEIDEKLKSHPLVFLNMCESAQVTPSLTDSFIDFFLDRGAIGVIGTECSMSLEFAHPFAKKFLTAVLSGEKVGHALLDARRYFLDYKNPLGLAYTLFGSATTCFQTTNVQGGIAVDDQVQERY